MLLDDDQLIVVLSLITIFILILFMISIVIRQCADDYPYQSVYIDPLDMNNGDLLFVSYGNVSGGVITTFSGSIWSHPGMIWVDPLTNIRYVLEGAIYRHKKYQHFFKIPFDTWLYFNRKYLTAYKKYCGPSINSDFLWSKFEWLTKKCQLDKLTIFWARFLMEKEYYEYAKRDTYSCLEATVILGQDAGIFKKDKIYCSYLPGDIANDKISYCEGVSYKKPVQITIHPVNHALISEDMIFHAELWKN